MSDEEDIVAMLEKVFGLKRSVDYANLPAGEYILRWLGHTPTGPSNCWQIFLHARTGKHASSKRTLLRLVTRALAVPAGLEKKP